MTIATLARIYWQRAQAKLKGAPSSTRPELRRAARRAREPARPAPAVHALLRPDPARPIELARRSGPDAAHSARRRRLAAASRSTTPASTEARALKQHRLRRGLRRAAWDSDDLVALLRIVAREIGRPIRCAPASRRCSARSSASRRCGCSTPARRARNIAAHYDLGNEMFELFLDARR